MLAWLVPACPADDPDATASTSGSEGTTHGSTDPTAPEATGSPTTTMGSASEAESTVGSESSPTDPSGSEAESSGGDEEIEIWELRTGGYMPPLQETMYSCFSFTFPVEQLHHIVGIVPQVTSPIVHHYVLSLADEPVELDPNQSCAEWPAHILWAWAPGIEEIELPPEAGFLVGHQGASVTFILQVHYNNPLLMPFADDGGIDLRVTRHLRPNRAGIFTQGDILSIFVPANDPSFEYVATCPGQQTSQALTEPVHVFASFLHAHQLGSALWTEVHRGGELVGEIARDDPFSFDTQTFTPAAFDIMPGDQLETHCIYDSSERDSPTMGGEESDEEMCINFMMYYPWIPSETCGVL